MLSAEYFVGRYTIVDECWVWKGCVDNSGYGYCQAGGERLAHRASFRVFKNNGHPLPNGRWNPVCHTCDNPSCINPAHLYLGTPQSNMDDKVARGRARGAPKGSGHHATILTEDQVRDIRAEYDAGGITHQELAIKNGVGRSTISRICGARDRFWKHV